MGQATLLIENVKSLRFIMQTLFCLHFILNLFRFGRFTANVVVNE